MTTFPISTSPQSSAICRSHNLTSEQWGFFLERQDWYKGNAAGQLMANVLSDFKVAFPGDGTDLDVQQVRILLAKAREEVVSAQPEAESRQDPRRAHSTKGQKPTCRKRPHGRNLA